MCHEAVSEMERNQRAKVNHAGAKRWMHVLFHESWSGKASLISKNLQEEISHGKPWGSGGSSAAERACDGDVIGRQAERGSVGPERGSSEAKLNRALICADLVKNINYTANKMAILWRFLDR